MHKGIRLIVDLKPQEKQISLPLNGYQCAPVRHANKLTEIKTPLEIRPYLCGKLWAVLIFLELIEDHLREKNHRQHRKTGIPRQLKQILKHGINLMVVIYYYLNIC